MLAAGSEVPRNNDRLQAVLGADSRVRVGRLAARHLVAVRAGEAAVAVAHADQPALGADLPRHRRARWDHKVALPIVFVAHPWLGGLEPPRVALVWAPAERQAVAAGRHAGVVARTLLHGPGAARTERVYETKLGSTTCSSACVRVCVFRCQGLVPNPDHGFMT